VEGKLFLSPSQLHDDTMRITPSRDAQYVAVSPQAAVKVRQLSQWQLLTTSSVFHFSIQAIFIFVTISVGPYQTLFRPEL
jgi:hypothetical protein